MSAEQEATFIRRSRNILAVLHIRVWLLGVEMTRLREALAQVSDRKARVKAALVRLLDNLADECAQLERQVARLDRTAKLMREDLVRLKVRVEGLQRAAEAEEARQKKQQRRGGPHGHGHVRQVSRVEMELSVEMKETMESRNAVWESLQTTVEHSNQRHSRLEALRATVQLTQGVLQAQVGRLPQSVFEAGGDESERDDYLWTSLQMLIEYREEEARLTERLNRFVVSRELLQGQLGPGLDGAAPMTTTTTTARTQATAMPMVNPTATTANAPAPLLNLDDYRLARRVLRFLCQHLHTSGLCATRTLDNVEIMRAFDGNELLAWLVRRGVVHTQRAAAQIARLLVKFGFIFEVEGHHKFTTQDLSRVYKFRADAILPEVEEELLETQHAAVNSVLSTAPDSGSSPPEDAPEPNVFASWLLVKGSWRDSRRLVVFERTPYVLKIFSSEKHARAKNKKALETEYLSHHTRVKAGPRPLAVKEGVFHYPFHVLVSSDRIFSFAASSEVLRDDWIRELWAAGCQCERPPIPLLLDGIARRHAREADSDAQRNGTRHMRRRNFLGSQGGGDSMAWIRIDPDALHNRSTSEREHDAGEMTAEDEEASEALSEVLVEWDMERSKLWLELVSGFTSLLSGASKDPRIERMRLLAKSRQVFDDDSLAVDAGDIQQESDDDEDDSEAVHHDAVLEPHCPPIPGVPDALHRWIRAQLSPEVPSAPGAALMRQFQRILVVLAAGAAVAPQLAEQALLRARKDVGSLLSHLERTFVNILQLQELCPERQLPWRLRLTVSAAALAASGDALPRIYAARYAHEDRELDSRLNEYARMSAKSLGLRESLCLPEDSASAADPYQGAIEQLRLVALPSDPFSQFTNILRVSDAICQCVDELKAGAGIVIGADDLLVFFVYIIIQARVPQLCARLHLIEDFCGELQENEMVYGYYLATTQAAVQAIATDECART